MLSECAEQSDQDVSTLSMLGNCMFLLSADFSPK